MYVYNNISLIPAKPPFMDCVSIYENQLLIINFSLECEESI